MKDLVCKVGFINPQNASEKKWSRPICGRTHTKKHPATVSNHWQDVTCVGCLSRDPCDAGHNHPLLAHLKEHPNA